MNKKTIVYSFLFIIGVVGFVAGMYLATKTMEANQLKVWEEGYKAGTLEVDPELNPYIDGFRSDWNHGYLAATLEKEEREKQEKKEWLKNYMSDLRETDAYKQALKEIEEEDANSSSVP